MGIRTRNLQNYLIELKYPQTITATTDIDIAVVPFAGRISNIVGVVGTPGTGANHTVCDIHLNGTTIFGGAGKLTFTSTTGLATYATLTAQPTPLAVGDILSLDVDSIGAAAPINGVVAITVTRQAMGDATHISPDDAA